MATSMTVEGIVYAASDDASTDGNTMDDYEEGTMTPTFSSTNGEAVYGYAVHRAGIYTKHGRTVTAWIDAQIDSTTGGSGSLRMALPFTAKDQYYSSVNSWNNTGSFETTAVAGYCSGGFILCYKAVDNNGSGLSAVATSGSTGRYTAQAIYEV